MTNITYLLVSNDTYKDILDIHVKQLQKYLINIPVIIAYNKPLKIDNIKCSVIEYDDTLPYCERIAYILSKINTKYVIYTHENNILINNIKQNLIDNLINFMENNNASQIRLFVGGINNPIFDKDNYIHKITNINDYYFSINMAIWNTNILYTIYNNFKDHNYICAECNDIQNYVKRLNNYYISTIYDIKLDGHLHYISDIFPFIHITSNGKWSTSNSIQYNYIKNLLNENNIDINIRGFI